MPSSNQGGIVNRVYISDSTADGDYLKEVGNISNNIIIKPLLKVHICQNSIFVLLKFLSAKHSRIIYSKVIVTPCLSRIICKRDKTRSNKIAS